MRDYMKTEESFHKSIQLSPQSIFLFSWLDVALDTAQT